MTADEALAFLAAHQPMPNCPASPGNSELTDELCDRYVDALDRLFDVPDTRCVPLLLGSFPDRTGVGMYNRVEDVLTRFPAAVVVPHLEASLRSDRAGVRYWSAQIAASFPDPRLIEPLAELLHEGDRDIRFFTVAALAEIDSEQVRPLLERMSRTETDDEVRTVIEDALTRGGA
ncbi:MAG: HEAT repeat domain-containing protein [Planctomycetaceae bacterium]